MLRLFIFLNFFLLCFFADYVGAEENNSSVKKITSIPSKELPTKIRSDLIDIKRKSQQVNFIGNVVIEREDSSLLSDKMIVLYDEEKEQKFDIELDNQENTKNSSIKKIYTDEKVKIFSEDFVATGDSGYFDPKEDIFVLEKNVMVNNGVSVARGDKFIHNLATKKSYFVGQKEDRSQGIDNRVMVILGSDARDVKESKKTKSKKLSNQN